MQSKSVEGICHGKRLLFRSLGWQRYLAVRRVNSSRTTIKNYYEILELKDDCTPSQIKQSFIRLSKELHPDKNPNSEEWHHKFILLNEAYSVLSRPLQRKVYDAELVRRRHNPKYRDYNGVSTNAPEEKVIFRDDSFWENRDRSEDKKYAGRHYYGVPGIKKMSNYYIGVGAFVFMIVGAIFHFFVAKVTSDLSIEHLNRRDKELSLSYRKVREQALANGNELQGAILLSRSQVSRKEKEAQVSEED